MRKMFLIFILLFLNTIISQAQTDNEKDNLDMKSLDYNSSNDIADKLVSTNKGDNKKNIFVTITADPSRIFEDPDNFDHGLDMVITMYLRKKSSNWEKLIRLENFYNLGYTKFGIGMQRLFPITKNKEGDNTIEISTGIEIGGIHRKKNLLDIMYLPIKKYSLVMHLILI